MSDFATREPLLTPDQHRRLAEALEDSATELNWTARLDAHSKSIELLCQCIENLSASNQRIAARLEVAERRIHDLIEVHGS